MNGHLWLEFFLQAFNPVFYNGQPFVDLTLLSQAKYPALSLLKGHSTLEILLLGHLVIQSEMEDSEDQSCSEELIYELFENYDCTKEDIHEALSRLVAQKWVEMYVETVTGFFIYKANLIQLIQENIYTENRWQYLFRLGLYGSKIARN